MSTKEEIIRIIKELPENVTIEEVMRELYNRSKIERGIRELNAGNTLSHSEVKEKLGKWLN